MIASRRMMTREGHGLRESWIYLLLFLVLVNLGLGHSAYIIDTQDSPSNRPPITFCTSDDCLRSAAHLRLSMNRSVDPCQNFYLYTCGRWSEQHPNCREWPDFDGFDMIDQQVLSAEIDVITANATDDEPQALQKMRDFYESCMDEEAREELGISAIYRHLENAHLPIIPTYISEADLWSDDEKQNFTFDWLKTEALLKQNLAVDILFASTVGINVFNSSEYVIEMGTPDSETTLPSPPGEPEETDETDEDRKNLTTLVRTRVIKYVLKKIYKDKTDEKPDADQLQKAVDVILRIEESLNEMRYNFTNPDEEIEIQKKTLRKLQDRTDQLLSSPRPQVWSSYFENLFNGTNCTIDADSDAIYVINSDFEYLSGVVEFVENTPDVEMELYYWWRAVYAMVINTSPKIVSYVTHQINKLKNITTEEDTSKSQSECVSLVSVHMGYAVTYALLDRFYSNEAKFKVELMLNNMRKAFMSHINEISWMDEATKKVTIEKAEEIILHIGFPDWISNKEELDRHYADVIIAPDAYLSNIINSIRSNSMKLLGSLRKELVREKWEYRGSVQNKAIVANAFYSPQNNAIEVPMAVLRYPMYRLGLELLNYGAIGAILGHEITHAFDNDGRKFDKFGNKRTWWSNATIENFRNLTECFVDHYEKISLEGVSGTINGTLTLAENIADNGGLRAALKGYQRYEESFGVEPKLPGFENFSTEQVFFISYASAWCMELQPTKDLEEETDEHAPHYLRVLGTLQNSEEFASAFHCPVGSFMNPEKKCKIW